MATQSMNMGMAELSSTEALKASIAEMVATALFIMIAIGAVSVQLAGGGVVGMAMAFGFTIALLVAGIRNISGAHINPAVTFAMMITGQTSVMRGVMYIVAQLIGACIGVLILRAFILDDVLKAIPGAGGNFLNEDIITDSWKGMFLEAMGTFVLVWTIFAVTVNPRAGSGDVAPLYIGLAVLVVHLFLIPLTGTGINPARTFGPALFLPSAAEGLPGRWDNAWVYYVGPLLGSAVAALSYYLLYLMPSKSET